MKVSKVTVNTDLILQDLKTGRNARTQKSLDQLNNLLKARFEKGEQDYSIATIGRLSKAKGGIGTVSIRNVSGSHFRLLIEAWATKAQTKTKKPFASHSRKYEIPSDKDLLRKVDDPALRVVFGQIIAEKNKLRAENHILKNTTEVIVDMRPSRIIQANDNQHVEVLPSLDKILVDSEIEALKDAINKDTMLKRGWVISRLGAVKDENRQSLFKSGFIPAIQKVLKEV
ncbi:gamma-mobile-trio protein GmtX [Acinetobacter indicus]|uniref:gamma-mobile-trio protein GmtX n=1 Tax=Acinetobacter indicus TaxID=756892 RepID=UPI002097E6D8|nr:gamma-mobile-trio protein GmtX [Acinetobacter indicus]MCO8108688.1 gamma-mobile-trio protein GmtX [Acinetobacter indicus]